MATPLAHSLAAMGLALAFLPPRHWLPGRRAVPEPGGQRSALRVRLGVGTAALLGIAPDFDFFPVVFLGYEQIEVHRTVTHSLVATLLVAIALAPLLRRLLALSGLRALLLGAAAYGSHLLLDLLVPDTLPPAGVQLFWPFSSRFVPPLPLLPMLDLDRIAAGELRPLLSTLVGEGLGVGAAVAVMLTARAWLFRPSPTREAP